jgi:hypothetical protein
MSWWQRFRLRGAVKLLRVRAGDKIVYTTDQAITAESAQRMKDLFERVLPPGVDVLVIDRGSSLSVLRAEKEPPNPGMPSKSGAPRPAPQPRPTR